LRRLLALLCAAALGSWVAPIVLSGVSVAAEAIPASRVEARSADLLAVGLVHEDRMSIHLSRQLDNAPLRDAVVTVVLRGVSHPTTAQIDGSYLLETRDLSLPGSAAIEFRIAEAGSSQALKGVLQIAAEAGRPEEKNSARQLGWWVLNFAVCIGFLLLISRRRKKSQD
jgi:hypothetical protein